jgi:signal transduction histidine kinase
MFELRRRTRTARRRPAAPVDPRHGRGARHGSIKLGLRLRFVAAILLTSAITLGVAAVALLSPLERRLRNDDLQALATSAQSAQADFTAVRTPAQVYPGSPQIAAAAGSVAHHLQARVMVMDKWNQAIYYGPSLDNTLIDVSNKAILQHRDDLREIVTDDGNEAAAVATHIRLPPHTGRGAILAVEAPLGEIHSAVGVVQRAFLVASAIALFVGLLVGTGLATRLLRRLRRLRQAVQRVGAQGLASEIPPDFANDEVADLTHAFRAMQEALRRQEESRHAFVATASHELRMPITSLHGMLELLDHDLSQNLPDLADARVQLAGARRQSARLVALARDLLDLSRLDAGVALRSEPVELVEVARAVLAEFELRGQAEDVELSLDADGPCWALADPGSVARIVRILVDNALRHSPRGETIVVRVVRGGESVELRVEDAGPGVPLAEAELVFERFSRGSTAGSDDSGFGLGLAIGRELAREMGGNLALVEAEQPGGRFALTLAGVSPEEEPPPEHALEDTAEPATP